MGVWFVEEGSRVSVLLIIRGIMLTVYFERGCAIEYAIELRLRKMGAEEIEATQRNGDVLSAMNRGAASWS